MPLATVNHRRALGCLFSDFVARHYSKDWRLKTRVFSQEVHGGAFLKLIFIAQ